MFATPKYKCRTLFDQHFDTLMCAAECGHTDVCQLLVAVDANVNIEDETNLNVCNLVLPLSV